MRVYFFFMGFFILNCQQFGNFWDKPEVGAPDKSPDKSFLTYIGGLSTSSANGYLHPTTDGGFLITDSANVAWSSATAGPSLLPFIASDLLVARYNRRGEKLWHTYLGGPGQDEATAIRETADGGCVVLGWTTTGINSIGAVIPSRAFQAGVDPVLFKLSAAGTLEWFTHLGGGAVEVPYDIALADDGGFIILSSANGTSTVAGAPILPYTNADDVQILKVNSTGAPQWHTYLGSVNSDSPGAVYQKNGDIYVTGSSAGPVASIAGFTGVRDGFLARLTGSGNLVWLSYFGASSSAENLSGLSVSDAGDILVTGETNAASPVIAGLSPQISGFAGRTGAILARYNSVGALSWFTVHGDAATNMQGKKVVILDAHYLSAANALAPVSMLPGRNAVLTPAPGQGIQIMKSDTAGNLLWHTSIGGGGVLQVGDVRPGPNGSILVSGKAPLGPIENATGVPILLPFEAGRQNGFILKLNRDGDLDR